MAKYIAKLTPTHSNYRVYDFNRVASYQENKEKLESGQLENDPRVKKMNRPECAPESSAFFKAHHLKEAFVKASDADGLFWSEDAEEMQYILDQVAKDPHVSIELLPQSDKLPSKEAKSPSKKETNSPPVSQDPKDPPAKNDKK